jgi:uncharacterized protein YndB with AHSA1/START domain
MPNIHQAVLIGSSPGEVYHAITTQEGLSGWWTPDASAKPAVDSIARFPFGPNYFKEMKVTELKHNERVKWECIKGADEWVGTSISFQLLPGDNETLFNSSPELQGQIEQRNSDTGTLLLFHHDDWRAYTLMFAECSYTWGQFLRSLKLLCETGKGRPWPRQHRTEL